MTEIAAAASSAASEATEARLRATEIATDFRSLEERVAEALTKRMIRRRSETPVAASPTPEGPAIPADSGTTAEFEALWDSFDRKADRIVQRLKDLEARTMTVIETPMPRPTERQSS